MSIETKNCAISPFSNEKGCWVIDPAKKNLGTVYFFGDQTLKNAKAAACDGRRRPETRNEGFFLYDKSGHGCAVAYPHSGVNADDLFTAFRDAS